MMCLLPEMVPPFSAALIYKAMMKRTRSVDILFSLVSKSAPVCRLTAVSDLRLFYLTF